jgi:hypothetical protein
MNLQVSQKEPVMDLEDDSAWAGECALAGAEEAADLAASEALDILRGACLHILRLHP